jgi:ABC-type multidrug transport system fused ATPase/permease subunit
MVKNKGMRVKHKERLHSRVIAWFGPDWKPISLASIFLLASIGFNLLKPWPLKLIIDHAIGSVPLGPGWEGLDHLRQALGIQGFLILSVGLLFLVHILWGWFSYVSNYQLIRVGLEAVVRLRVRLFDHLQRLSMRFYDQKPSADLAYRLVYDTQAMQTFINQGFVTVISSGLTLVGIIAFMYSIDPLLTLISLGVVPLLLLAIRHYAAKVRSATGTWNQCESRLLGRSGEFLTGMRLIQVFTRERETSQRYRNFCSESFQADMALRRVQVRSTFVVGVVIALGTALLLYFGSGQVLDGVITLGDLILFVSYLAMLYQPLEQLSYTAWAMEGAVAQAERVFQILDEPRGISSPPDPRPLPREWDISFDQVTFAYEPDTPVLDQASFEIAAGMTAAVVGGSGSGKSTLLSLIPRFYDPDDGSIRLGGIDLRDFDLHELRGQISLVTQESIVFDASIRDNLRIAEYEATDEQLWQALEAAHLDLYVRKLKGGLDSPVGERGQWLSGGQRQRLSLARAFLRESTLLLLDEPTSAVDPRTESELMETMSVLGQSCTTLIASHRLRSVHGADIILVMDEGRIIESGRGPELLEKGGAYAALWHHRF